MLIGSLPTAAAFADCLCRLPTILPQVNSNAPASVGMLDKSSSVGTWGTTDTPLTKAECVHKAAPAGTACTGRHSMHCSWHRGTVEGLGTAQTVSAECVQDGCVAKRFHVHICRTADVLCGDPQKDNLPAQPSSCGFYPVSMVSTESPVLVRSVSSLTTSTLDVHGQSAVECDCNWASPNEAVHESTLSQLTSQFMTQLASRLMTQLVT